MKTSEGERKSNYEWKKRNKKTLVCIMYKQDAEDFRAWCEAQGKSVNEALREYVAECLGRPLERRDGSGEAGNVQREDADD